jgi:hypothetical protein
MKVKNNKQKVKKTVNFSKLLRVYKTYNENNYDRTPLLSTNEIITNIEYIIVNDKLHELKLK